MQQNGRITSVSRYARFAFPYMAAAL